MEKTVITASQYCELIEPHFETSYGSEATCGDVASVKQLLIIFYWGPVICLGLCHDLSLESLLDSYSVMIGLQLANIEHLEIFSQVLLDAIP